MTGLVKKSAHSWLVDRLGRFPFHTLLVAVYVWLSPYVTNHEKLFLDSVLPVGVVAIAAAVILLSLIWAIVRNGRAAGLMSTLIIVCLVYYGLFFDATENLVGDSLKDKKIMPIWVGLFIALIAASFIWRSRLVNLTKVLNVSALFLVLMPLGTLVLDVVGGSRPGAAEAAPGFPGKAFFSNVARTDIEYPDIYYLIFDRYADNRTLQQVYGYDNSEFLDYLRGKGF